MIEVRDLLSRFENLLFSKRIQKSIIQESIKEVVGLDIPIENIEIKNLNILIDSQPIYKNEIFLNKEKILNLIYKKSPQKPFEDIK